jgi:uncharacterized protein (UPF0128 family)
MTNNIQITTSQGASEPLSADRVVFTASINQFNADSGKIAFISEDDFTMYHLEYSINFRLAAAIDLPQGLYYIDWTIDETSFDGTTENVYDPPVKTLVEVYSKSKASFVIETIVEVGVG